MSDFGGPGPVEATIAPYTSQSSLILAGGVTLIVVNFLDSQQGAAIIAQAGIAPASGSSPANNTTWLDLGLQGAALVLLLLISSVSEAGGDFGLVFLAALWLAFLYAKRARIASFAKAVLPPIAGSSTASSPSSTPSSSPGPTG